MDNHVALCPMCNLLPVARKCLDCVNDPEITNCNIFFCSACFHCNHNTKDKRGHRFLRICNTRESSEQGGMLTVDGSQGNSDGLLRCSICSEIDATRWCHDCNAFVCACCFVQTHREPSMALHKYNPLGEMRFGLSM